MCRPGIYHIVALDEPRQFVCVKLDENFVVVDHHFLEDQGPYAICGCPAGSMEKECRHTKVLRVFQRRRLLGKRVVYDFKRAREIWAEEEVAAA
jgi:hypothetical protein